MAMKINTKKHNESSFRCQFLNIIDICTYYVVQYLKIIREIYRPNTHE